MSRIRRVLSGGINRHTATRVLAAASIFGVLVSAGLVALPVRPASAAAGINKQINFQGKVTNTNGTNVVNGSYSFTFKLYSAASGGAAIWTETKSLTITDGVFQTNLGSSTALPGSVDFNTDNIYLGMAFNGDPEMTPRIQLTAAAYAFNSDALQGLHAADFAQINPSSAQSGSLNVTGSVQAATSLQAPLVDTATAVALNIGTGTASSVTIGRTTTPFLVQGNSSSTFTATNGANTTTVSFAAPSANNSIVFPNAGGTVCTTTASTCSATYQTAGNYLAKNAADTSSFAVTATNFLYGFTNSSSAVASGVLKLDNGSNTGSGLTVIGSGNPAAGQALILANGATGITGKLIDLQVNSASKFAVDQAGAVTTGSTINGQTITSAASFTGTVTAATSLLAPLLDTASAGALNIGTTNATSINLKKDTLTSGRATITPGTDALASPQLRVTSSTGNNAFTVGTSATLTQVGINLSSTNTPSLSGNGLQIQGALRLTGGGGSGTNMDDVFTTPVGSSVATKINVPLYDPGAFSQVVAMGLPSTANASARALSLFDARTVAHQPTLAVLSPDENNVFGLSWEGDNTTAWLKNSANNITLQANSLNILKATNSSGNAVVEIGNNGLLKTSTVDTAAAGTLSLGTSTATGVTVGGSGFAVSIPGGLTTSNSNINAGTGTITSGAINGQTISSTASFTGTVQAATSFIGPLFVTADVASGTSGGVTLRSGNATAGNGSTGNVTVDTGAKNGTGFNGNINIGATNALNVNIGHNAATASGTAISLQGLAATSQFIMNDATNANKTTVSFTTPTAARSIVFPDAGGTICTTTASTCSGTYQAAGTYLTKNAADTSSASVVGNLYGFTNSSSGAAGVLALTNSGTNAALSVTSSANASSGQAVILATNTNGTPSGNLIDLRVTAGSRFAVDTAGAVTTSSTINGQTISSTANFTGTVTSASTITASAGGISVTGTGTFNNAVNITGLTTTSGGITNNSAGIAAAGAISGATTIVASSDIQGGGLFKTADTAAAATASAAVTLRSGNASGTGGASGSGSVTIDSGTSTNGTTGAISVGTANASAVTIGRAGAPTTVQGNSSLAIQANNGANYSVIQFTAPTAQVAYTLGTNGSNTSANICTSLAASCNTTYQPYIASGYLVKSPTSNEASSSNFAGYQYTFTQSNGASSGNLSLINAGTSSALLVTQSSNPSAGQALVTINNSNATPSGNVLDLQKGGTSQFAVDFAGNVTTLAGASSGKFNGQTISSTANFTGTVTSASGITVTAGGIAVGGNSNITGTLGVSSTLTVSANGASITGGINNNSGGITNAGAVSGLSSLQYSSNGTLDTAAANSITIGGTNANNVTIGRTTGTPPSLTLQGNSGSVFTATGASGATTLAFATLSAAGKTVTIPNETGTICTSASSSTSNCTNFAPATGGTGYIQNQNAIQQVSSNFWISAVGRADTSFLTPTLDTATAVNLNIGASGGPTATQININQNTVLASGKSLTVQGALTQSGGALTLAGNAASSVATSAGALTITSAAAATWSTSTGALTVDSAAALNLGTSAATSLSIGKTGVTTTHNGVNQIGASAGTGSLVNNGSTTNTEKNITNLSSGGSIGGAAGTVDIYTYISVSQTTTGQTITIPSPTASTTYGKIIYLTNTGTASFTLLGTIIGAGSTATLVWANVNSVGTWTYAGSDGSGVLNQNASDQTANFRITGVGQANTSFRGPLFDAISASTLNIGTSTANAISLGSSSVTTTNLGTFQLGSAAGSGSLINNGSTVNTVLSIANLPSGGAIGTAAATVDIYTSFAVTQTTSGQTVTIPSPTASTTYGRVIYLSNVGTTAFILSGVRVPAGSTATMIWSNTNGAASWQFAGAGASSIENQNFNDQVADFRITGTGVLQTGLQIGGTAYCSTGCGDLNFATGSNRTLKVLAAASGNGGNSLTIQAGDGTGTNQAGGALVLQGGTATGSGAGGVVTVKSQTNSTTAFTVQNSTGVAQLTVDTSGSTVTIGDSTNGATFASTREVTFNGTARHQKSIRLTAEYAGAVLDSGGQSSVTGTMTAGYDSTQRFGYYKWTTGQATAQTYDVVVTIPLPDDWSAWNGNPQIKDYASSVAAGNTIQVINMTRTDGSADTTFAATPVNITPGSTSTWTTYSSKGLDTTGYSAGGSMTIRLRLSSISNSDIRLGDIILPYYSKY